jgi:ATP-binding cassette subfamily A (ABC1) protein 3
MDEAEALCPKIGIMVEGRFKCFGSSQYLKNKYGMGYEIEVKIRGLFAKEFAENKKICGGKDSIKNADIKSVLQKLNAVNLFEKISAEDAGREIHRMLKLKGEIEVEEFLKWVHIQKNGCAFLAELDNKFKKSALIENFNNSFTVKTSRDNSSIGFVFGMLEELKERHSIQEYSVA